MNKLGFGFLRLPQKRHGSLDYENINKMVDLYMEKGIRCFDTCYTYMDGKSELAFKKCVSNRYPREAFKLTDIGSVKTAFLNFSFNNARPITKSMLVWWALLDDNQKLLSLETVFEIEHIYAKNRQDKEHLLENIKNLEALGNKAILEKHINISASDYRFEDKKKYYKGYFIESRNQEKKGTDINELLMLAQTNDDFIETDIINRTNDMIERFMRYITENGLSQ